jgi:hypothetical protein
LIYLIGRSGEYLGFFAQGTSADRMVEIIRQHFTVTEVSHFASIQLSSNREHCLFDTGRFKLPFCHHKSFGVQ